MKCNVMCNIIECEGEDTSLKLDAFNTDNVEKTSPFEQPHGDIAKQVSGKGNLIFGCMNNQGNNNNKNNDIIIL